MTGISGGGRAWAAQILDRPVRRTSPAAGAEQPPFLAEVVSRSHVTFVQSPGSDVGPVAVHVPVTGHNLFLDVTAEGGPVVLRSLTAEVVGRGPLVAEGTSFATPRTPDLVLDPRLAPVAGRSVQAYEELEIPQHEVLLLGGAAAQVRPARDAYGRRLRPGPVWPLEVPAGAACRIVLAVVTDEPDLLRWRLHAVATQGGRTWQLEWDLRISARPVMRKFVPGGSGPIPVPVHERFPQHWQPRWPVGPAPLPRGADEAVRLPAIAQAGRVVAADGALVITVDECEVPDDPVGFPGLPAGTRLWVYGTVGLAAAGLTEVTAAVLPPGGGREPLDSGLIELIIGMYSAAVHQGWRMRVNDVIGFGRPIDVGGREIGGALITHAAGDGAWFPADWPPLLLVPLFDGEMEAVGRHGRGRVLANLAATESCFPYPWWFDPSRPPVVDPDTYDGSTVLDDVSNLRDENVMVVEGPGELMIIVDRERHAVLGGAWTQMPPRFALIPRYTTMTGRARVWWPDQSAPSEVVAALPRSQNQAGVHFLLFIQGGSAVTVDPMEDGFVVGLPVDDWYAMGTHLRAGRPIEWRTGDGTRLSVGYSGG
ncbi:hypothetical protein ACQEVZ_41585 [Dactylosporangium sp. CA-152071]|uniref:hypothetical protein n=1 Tax=Dactylosporangium sp. CA-152071 TaxID=3239933 RepID=UPI003D914645